MEVIDLKGLKCPLPALIARKALARAAAGTEITIVTDDPFAIVDVPHMCHQEGHAVLAVERRNAVVHLVLRRGAQTLSPYS